MGELQEFFKKLGYTLKVGGLFTGIGVALDRTIIKYCLGKYNERKERGEAQKRSDIKEAVQEGVETGMEKLGQVLQEYLGEPDARKQ